MSVSAGVAPGADEAGLLAFDEVGGSFGEAEVDEVKGLGGGLVEDEVLRFDVPVDEVFGVKGFDPGEHLNGEFDGVVEAEILEFDAVFDGVFTQILNHQHIAIPLFSSPNKLRKPMFPCQLLINLHLIRYLLSLPTHLQLNRNYLLHPKQR